MVMEKELNTGFTLLLAIIDGMQVLTDKEYITIKTEFAQMQALSTYRADCKFNINVLLSFLDQEAETIAEVLGDLFWWRHTNAGDPFWEKIVDKIDNYEYSRVKSIVKH